MKKMKKTLLLTAVIMALNVFPVNIFGSEEDGGFESTYSQEEKFNKENGEITEEGFGENTGTGEEGFGGDGGTEEEEGNGEEIADGNEPDAGSAGMSIQESPMLSRAFGLVNTIALNVSDTSFATDLEQTLGGAVLLDGDTVIELDSSSDEVSFEKAVELTFPADFTNEITLRYDSDTPLVIKSSDTNRHFIFTGNNSVSPRLKFENIILDGGNVSGGIHIDGNMGFSLEGAEIQNCYYTDSGGGLYAEGKSLTVTNCTFRGNVSEYAGGGLFAHGNTSTAISNSVFEGNSATGNGGGIHILGYNLSHTMDNCEVRDNVSGSKGGGLFVQSDMTISDSKFTGNRAEYGGAIAEHDRNRKLRIIDSEISGNYAEGNGGGILPSGSLALEKSKILNNSSDGDGGGIYAEGNGSNSNTIHIDGGEISGNHAEGDGGGIFIKYYSTPSDVAIKDNKITDNGAGGKGGGIFVTDSQPVTMENNEITYNRAEAGGGIYIADPNDLTIPGDSFGFNLADMGYDSTIDGGDAQHFPQWNNVNASAPFTHILNNYDISHIPADADSGLTYTAVFKLNDGTTKEAGRVALDITQPAALGEKFPAAPVRAGYDFKSWNTEADGSGDSVTKDTVFEGDQNVLLYGQWQKKAGVITPPPTDNGNNNNDNNDTGSSRDRNGKDAEYVIGLNTGEGSPVKNITVKANGKLAQPDNPLREGHRFTGWYTDQSFTKLYDFDTKAEQNFTLYAGWEAIETEDEEIFETPSLSAYISGYPDGTFRPDASISWAESMVMLSNAVGGQESNSDALWYEDALNALPEVISDYLGDGFEGDKEITRGEFTVLALAFMDMGIYEGKAPFSDIEESTWGAGYIYTAAVKGIISGYPDGTFMPDKGVSRAEAVVIINKITGRNRNTLSSSRAVGFSDLSSEHWAYEAVTMALGEHRLNK